MKAILEFNAPESCGVCILRKHQAGNDYCNAFNLNCVNGYVWIRAPFCPLRIAEGGGEA